jgi:acyl carrier protein
MRAERTKDEVIAVIFDCLRNVNAGINSPELENPTSETRLIGSHSPLDSIGLVNLIADLEEALANRFGKDLVLADERAVSRMHSPFRRVDSLADYVIERLREDQN